MEQVSSMMELMEALMMKTIRITIILVACGIILMR